MAAFDKGMTIWAQERRRDAPSRKADSSYSKGMPMKN